MNEMHPELTPHLMGILEVMAQDREACQQLCITQVSYGEATQMDIGSEGRNSVTESWDGRWSSADMAFSWCHDFSRISMVQPVGNNQ